MKKYFNLNPNLVLSSEVLIDKSFKCILSSGEEVMSKEDPLAIPKTIIRHGYCVIETLVDNGEEEKLEKLTSSYIEYIDYHGIFKENAYASGMIVDGRILSIHNSLEEAVKITSERLI